ncbi:hypothetical protein HDV00_010663 [Rhizophlyctis rosea]|nr:hypothetical protein HDV00_010663 [Rhizophlyctis rosea]
MSATAADSLQPWMREYTPEQMLQLKEFVDDVTMPWTPTWYSMNAVVFMVALYAGAKAIQTLSRIFGPRYFKKMKESQQRVAIVHVLEIIVTTIMFGIQIYCSPLYWGNFDKGYMQFGGVIANMACLLYSFELIYRSTMRTPLLLHHLATMFLISFLFVVLYKTHHPAYLQLGLSFIYQATTEQSIFIGLLMYRFLKPCRITALTLYFAAIQTLLCKLASLFHSIYLWTHYLIHVDAVPRDYHTAFSVVFTICFVCLLGTQVWGSWVVWTLGKKVDAALRKEGIVGWRGWVVEVKEVPEEDVEVSVIKGKEEKKTDGVEVIEVVDSAVRQDTPSMLVDLEAAENGAQPPANVVSNSTTAC